MGYITHNMDRAVTRTRWFGYWALFVGALVLGFGLLVFTSGKPEIGYRVLIGSCLFYILPGGLLLLFAWRMDKLELWAYLATSLLCLGFVVKFATAMAMAYAGQIRFYETPLPAEILLRTPAIYLFVSCLNALPDVRDEHRMRRRRNVQRGFEPIMTAQAPPARPDRLPPRPTNIR